MQAFFFPLRSYHVMEIYCFANGLLNIERPCAEVFKLADIILQWVIRCGKQGDKLF